MFEDISTVVDHFPSDYVHSCAGSGTLNTGPREGWDDHLSPVSHITFHTGAGTIPRVNVRQFGHGD